jgi:DNA invertase Pin-like site-specific DNA recombinase
MGKVIGYIQYENDSDKILQKAAIDKFAKDKFNQQSIDYVYEKIEPFISWKNRILGKELLPSLEEKDILIVSESKRLGNSSPEIDVLLMYVTEKGAEVYEAKLDTKISGD